MVASSTITSRIYVYLSRSMVLPPLVLLLFLLYLLPLTLHFLANLVHPQPSPVLPALEPMSPSLPPPKPVPKGGPCGRPQFYWHFSLTVRVTTFAQLPPCIPHCRVGPVGGDIHCFQSCGGPSEGTMFHLYVDRPKRTWGAWTRSLWFLPQLNWQPLSIVMWMDTIKDIVMCVDAIRDPFFLLL